MMGFTKPKNTRSAWKLCVWGGVGEYLVSSSLLKGGSGLFGKSTDNEEDLFAPRPSQKKVVS